MPELSIIIPALNEEKYLPKLLGSIKKQSYNDYEIIVADAGSKDKTRGIAANYNCKIVEGGLPAKGRNSGAKIAKGKILLFFDADVILPKNFLSEVMTKFKKDSMDLATTYVKPLTAKKLDRFGHEVTNLLFYLLQKIDPYAPGFCLLSTKEMFNKIKGFDETIKLAEDHAFVRKGYKLGAKFSMFRNPKILVSVRRLDTEGRPKLAFKYMMALLHRTFFGEIKSDIFNYKFEHKEK